MTKTPHELVAEFHQKFGLAYEQGPRHLERELAMFRIGFMLEEIAEYTRAAGFSAMATALEGLISDFRKNEGMIAWREPNFKHSLHDQLDALVDLSYVLHGTAYLQGFNIDGAFAKVHEANMKKVRAERASDSKRGSAYDVVKPEGWTPPDLTEFVA